MRVIELLAGGPAEIDWERVRADAPGLHALAMDICENGLQEPIRLDPYGRIEDGVHRTLSLWLLGFQGDVPATRPSPTPTGYEEGAFWKLPHLPTITEKIREAMLQSGPEEWENYWGWLALKLDTSIIAGDPFLEWLHARHPFRCGVLSMDPFSFYGWHTDGRRGVSINMLTDFTHGRHSSMFALPRDQSRSQGRFFELHYEPNRFYLFNNQVEHTVVNYEGNRFVFSIEFDEDKDTLNFAQLKREIEE